MDTCIKFNKSFSWSTWDIIFTRKFSTWISKAAILKRPSPHKSLQCMEGEVLSLFSTLIDMLAPNLIFIQIFAYLQEAS